MVVRSGHGFFLGLWLLRFTLPQIDLPTDSSKILETSKCWVADLIHSYYLQYGPTHLVIFITHRWLKNKCCTIEREVSTSYAEDFKR